MFMAYKCKKNTTTRTYSYNSLAYFQNTYTTLYRKVSVLLFLSKGSDITDVKVLSSDG